MRRQDSSWTVQRLQCVLCLPPRFCPDCLFASCVSTITSVAWFHACICTFVSLTLYCCNMESHCDCCHQDSHEVYQATPTLQTVSTFVMKSVKICCYFDALCPLPYMWLKIVLPVHRCLQPIAYHKLSCHVMPNSRVAVQVMTAKKRHQIETGLFIPKGIIHPYDL